MKFSVTFMGFSNNFHGRFCWNKLLPWMYIHGNVRGSRWKYFYLGIHGNFHCRWNRKLPLLQSIVASTNMFRRSFHELPSTPLSFHLLPRVSQTSTYLNRTPTRVHRVPFDLLPLTFPPTCTETSVEVNLLPWKLPWNSVKASMEVHGSRWKNIYFHGDFHGSWWK